MRWIACSNGLEQQQPGPKDARAFVDDQLAFVRLYYPDIDIYDDKRKWNLCKSIHRKRKEIEKGFESSDIDDLSVTPQSLHADWQTSNESAIDDNELSAPSLGMDIGNDGAGFLESLDDCSALVDLMSIAEGRHETKPAAQDRTQHPHSSKSGAFKRPFLGDEHVFGEIGIHDKTSNESKPQQSAGQATLYSSATAISLGSLDDAAENAVVHPGMHAPDGVHFVAADHEGDIHDDTSMISEVTPMSISTDSLLVAEFSGMSIGTWEIKSASTASTILSRPPPQKQKAHKLVSVPTIQEESSTSNTYLSVESMMRQGDLSGATPVAPPHGAYTKVLITGGAGFNGSQVADYMLARGHTVVILDAMDGYSDVESLEGYLQWVKKKHGRSRLKIYQGDVRDEDLVSRILKDEAPKWIYHMAAGPECLSVGTEELIVLAREHGVENFVYGEDIVLMSFPGV